MRTRVTVSMINGGGEEIDKERWLGFFLGVIAGVEILGFSHKCMHCLAARVLPPSASAIHISIVWLRGAMQSWGICWIKLILNDDFGICRQRASEVIRMD